MNHFRFDAFTVCVLLAIVLVAAAGVWIGLRISGAEDSYAKSQGDLRAIQVQARELGREADRVKRGY